MNAPTDQSATAVATDQDDSVAGTWTTRTTATSPAGGLPPRGDVVATAVAAGERAAEIRRDQLTHDLERWKSVVVAIADGGEPDGRLLAEIAELTVRTQLPEGALAQDVAVVATVSKLEDRLKRAEAELENSVQTAAAKQEELRAARPRAAVFAIWSRARSRVVFARGRRGVAGRPACGAWRQSSSGERARGVGGSESWERAP